MIDNDLQKCPHCQVSLRQDGFYPSAWGKRGKYCKSCQRGLYKQKVEIDPEYFLKYQRARRARLNPNARIKRPDNHAKVEGKRYCADCATHKVRADWSPVNWATSVGYCKSCSNIRAKDYMARHPEYRSKIAGRRDAAWQQIADIKLALGCRDCGYRGHPSALDFHHRNAADKRFTVGRCLGMSLESLMLEIAKCDLLCANCHRIHHYTERQDRKRAVADLTSTLGQ